MPATNRPHLGILLPTREQAMLGAIDGPALVSFAVQAEALGYDSVWVGDSLVARPRLDPLVALAAVASATTHVGIGTAAMTAALRHPLIAANMITSLDHVSAGRLTLALGSGFPIPETEAEFAAVGASYQGRAGQLDDIVALWRQAWRSTEADADTTYTGRHFNAENLDRLPAPVRPGGPALWLAGSDTPAVLRRVARRYDGWLPFLPSLEAYRAARRQIAELTEENGRPAAAVSAGLYATINVNPDEAAGRAEMEGYIRRYYNNTLENMSQIQAYAWGSAERCADWLSGYIEAGASHIIIRIGALHPERQLKEIAETVLPALRA